MNYIYVDEESIHPLLKCKICTKPFIDPVITRDNDRFCRLCITEKATLVNTSEPDYQPSFFENLLSVDERIIQDMLDNLLVQCPDCQEKNILRKDLETHLLSHCPKRIVSCKASDLKCPWSGIYDQSAEHITTCTFELLRPILSERCQHKHEFEQYQKSIAEQKNEIEQLKAQLQEYKDRTEKCEKFQNDIQQSFNDENLRQKQLHQDIQQLREQYDQMNTFCQQLKDDLSKSNQLQSKEFENILQQSREHSNQTKKYQDYDNQITQLQKQDSLRNDEMLRIREKCNQHEIQIHSLARKTCVVPLEPTTADPGSDSDEQSDTGSVAGVTVGDGSQTENTIYIQNLPSTVKHYEIFGIFQKIGRVKYNYTHQKPDMFIFNKLNKNGHCAAKVTFVDKESVAAAIAEFNHKHIPQWNTHLRVSKFIPDPNRKNAEGGAQGKNENIGAQQNTKAAGAEQPQPPNEQNSETPKKNKHTHKQHSDQGDKTKTEN